jgi:uncharacterized protein (TIGR02145 family)
VKIGVSHTITYEPLLTAGGEYILTADGEIILIAVLNNFPLRIPIKKACQGYYLRWYYNGYHYWFFLPGKIITNTDGEVYRTIGTRKITMGSGQVTYGQINALRTIRNAMDIQLLTIDGWMNIRIEPGSVIVKNNYINGYEFDFTTIVGSREGYYSPVVDVPELPGNPHAITITHHNHGIFTMILTGHGVIIIDWGDGTPPETYTLTDVPLVITHDYTGTTGDHTITIEGEENIETLTADGQHITEITIPATATSLTELHLPNNELTDSPYIPDTVPLVIMDLLNNPLTICEVYVGSQIWMCYNYDSAFPTSKVYDDNEANRALYGGLYTYDQIKTPGFVIAGWHVPTYDEWLALIAFIGGTAAGGGKLKEVGVVTWDAPNTGAVDTYGFKAKGSGCWIYVFGVGMSYYNLKKYGYFWADSPAGYNYAFYCQYDSAALSLLPLVPPTDMSYAPYFSVRLLKNFSYSTPNFGSLTDYDGNIYTYITIGTQQWIIENLHTTRYGDGTAIANLILNAAWAADVTGAYCWYNNDAVTNADYGMMYNWYAVNNAHVLPYFKRNGIFEAGWRVATRADYITLSTFLGGDAISGGKLKEVGLTHWTPFNTFATDEFGFKALPGGYRSDAGVFTGINQYGLFWTSTQNLPATAYDRRLRNIEQAFDEDSISKKNGFSIRCMRDVP